MIDCLLHHSLRKASLIPVMTNHSHTRIVPKWWQISDSEFSRVKRCDFLTDPEYLSHWKIRLERIIAISRANVFLCPAPNTQSAGARPRAAANRSRSRDGTSGRIAALATKYVCSANRNNPFLTDLSVTHVFGANMSSCSCVAKQNYLLWYCSRYA